MSSLGLCLCWLWFWFDLAIVQLLRRAARVLLAVLRSVYDNPLYYLYILFRGIKEVQRTRTPLHPTALASVPFGIVLVRVRVRKPRCHPRSVKKSAVYLSLFAWCESSVNLRGKKLTVDRAGSLILPGGQSESAGEVYFFFSTSRSL